MMKKLYGPIALALLLALLCTQAAQASATPRKSDGGAQTIAVGSDPLPFALKNLKGTETKLEDLLQKKAVLMVFWSLFCGPCQEELPLIDAMGKKYAEKGLEVLTINLDGEARMKALEQYMKKRGFAFNVLLEKIDGVKYITADAYGVSGTPTVIMIDKKGKISHVNVGQEKEEELEKAILAALND